MHEFFRKAINPRPEHTCLRLRLLPLTVGHLFLLSELDCAAPEGGQFEGMADLLLAALVCAQPHEKARRMLGHFRRLSLFAFYWGWRCRKMDIPTEVYKMRLYLRAEQAMPPLQPISKEEGHSINAPWPWVLFEMLCSTYRMSKAEALSVPVCTANALWVVKANMEGRLNLATAQTGMASLIHELWRAARSPNQNRNGEELCRD